LVKRVVVKKDVYRDSISLMRISTSLEKLPGVSQAAVVMATDLNRRVLSEAGFSGGEVAHAATDDMIVAVDAKDERSLRAALEEADALLLSQGERPPGEEAQPKSLDEAIETLPDANLAVISVPGQFAGREASRALERGLDVFLFSSNVPLEKELELKRSAESKGLLMMGPDCGTAIINHKVFGFGNVVREGSFGIVSASGTGLQEVSTLIHKSGLGISQAIGTGSGDMSEAVGGTTMLRGIRMLEADIKTKTIILISKPPAPRVAAKILDIAKRCRKPVVVNFLGADLSREELGSARAAKTLEEAVEVACSLAGTNVRTGARAARAADLATAARTEWSRLGAGQRYVRGLFAGGTLCYESQVILGPILGEVYSNGPISPKQRIEGDGPSKKHCCIDMGAEEFVEGRLHPMIDFTLRNKRILKEAADPETAVLLLDVELGYGSNPDPAGELVPYIKRAKTFANESGRFLSVVASIVATEGDFQDLKKQEDGLRGAGVLVAPSNAAATRVAAAVATRAPDPVANSGGGR
jgi:FdrA protein